jgi:hypothetical protein
MLYSRNVYPLYARTHSRKVIMLLATYDVEGFQRHLRFSYFENTTAIGEDMVNDSSACLFVGADVANGEIAGAWIAH